tara:strand:+ start:759 stop:1457 length:699 start_codon:yes stop_codon:yes gene_type:complete
MNKTILTIVIFLSLTINVSAARIGGGSISIDQDFRDSFQQYLVSVRDNLKYVFVFAANNEGTGFWFGADKRYKSQAWQQATESAIENCNEVAQSMGQSKCKVLAKGSKILWKWDQIENELYKNKKEIISPKDVRVIIGTGEISPSYQVEQVYKDSIKYMKAFDKPSEEYIFYLAISLNGQTYGLAGGTSHKNAVSNRLDDDVKKSAVAECMTDNNGKICYLYASHEGILWKF